MLEVSDGRCCFYLLRAEAGGGAPAAGGGGRRSTWCGRTSTSCGRRAGPARGGRRSEQGSAMFRPEERNPAATAAGRTRVAAARSQPCREWGILDKVWDDRTRQATYTQPNIFLLTRRWHSLVITSCSGILLRRGLPEEVLRVLLLVLAQLLESSSVEFACSALLRRGFPGS
jgi:hypothetical protein